VVFDAVFENQKSPRLYPPKNVLVCGNIASLNEWIGLSFAGFSIVI
jgi:hypothetical protein